MAEQNAKGPGDRDRDERAQQAAERGAGEQRENDKHRLAAPPGRRVPPRRPVRLGAAAVAKVKAT